MESNKTTSNSLEDLKVNVKIKLSALWTSVMFCYIYGDYFELYVPKKVEGLLNGHSLLDNPMKLFAASVMLTIPALMIFLSLMLRPKINRLLNMIIGAFFTLVMLLIAIGSLTEWKTFYVFLAVVESTITSLIIWQAWTWPKIK
jgi:hypothetical protein